MPLPSRQKELYEKVKRDLREKYRPGMCLPTEPFYAQVLGCGRTTLRKVLSTLQEENLIRRTHRGTIVLDSSSPFAPVIPGTGKSAEEERPLFMLIPCTRYTEKVDEFSLMIHHQVMAGAMREAINCGSHLVTLPVSESNKSNGIECIDFALSQLKSLRKGDKVIFFGRWFRRILPVLAEKKCLVAYISQMPYAFEEDIKELDTAAAFTGYSTSAFITAGLEELKKRGRKHVKCVYFSLDEEEHKGVKKAFSTFLASHDMQGEFYALPFHITPEEKLFFLHRFFREKGGEMDSFILSPHLRTPTPFEMNPAIPQHILTVCEKNALTCAGRGNTFVTVRDDLERNVRALAKALLSGKYFPATLYPYQTEE